MSEQIPTIGRTVHFRLSADDAAQINRRRTTRESIADRLKRIFLSSTNHGIEEFTAWPAGAQAHIGNTAREGAIVPMVIVAVWSDTCVNGQALLDGSDSFWVLSATQGAGPHQWDWPPRD